YGFHSVKIVDNETVSVYGKFFVNRSIICVGSVRTSAALYGIIGLKPSFGRIPHSGLINSSRVATKPDRDALRFIGQIVDTLPLTPTCPHCAAIKFYSEADNFCCMEGRIVIPDNELPDNHLKQLLPLTLEDPESFRTYIRTYSNLFVFTSMGVKADNSFTRRNKEFYTFRVQGRYNNKECLSTSIGYEKDNKMAWLNELVTV
ncbi:hypothetical protein Tco_1496439, partial [Tanacetum coccineum]